MFNIQHSLKGIGRFIGRNSNHILTGVAVTGTITTTVLAVKATPKAIRLIEEHECRTDIEMIKTAWMCYIPAGISLVITMGSIIGLNVINERKRAALVGLYSIAQTTLKEYQDKVVETIGENKERKIRDEIDADRVLNNPPRDVILTGSGDVLCLDSLTGRYFTSDIEKIKKVVNEVNRELILEMFVPLNDLFYELGLESTKLGDELGFSMDHSLLEIKFSSQLTQEGKPCLVLNYDVYSKDL